MEPERLLFCRSRCVRVWMLLSDEGMELSRSQSFTVRETRAEKEPHCDGILELNCKYLSVRIWRS